MELNTRLRICVIGAGHIGQAHIAAFSGLRRDCEIVAICDPCEERARSIADRYAIRGRYADYHEMIDTERPDCVVICTPTYLHCPQTIAALEMGASVLCEKPMAITVAEAIAMKRAAEKSGRVMYIGFNHRFYGKFTKAKEVLSESDPGQLTSMVGAIGHGGWKNHDGTWFTEKKLSGGGAFITCGIHLVDMLLWYGAKITSVSAIMRRRYLSGDCEDDALALLNFEGGGIGSLHASYAWRHPYGQHLRMNWERLTIDIRDNDILVTRSGQTEPERIECNDEDSFLLQASAFIAAVRGKAAPFVSADDGIAALRVALAAYASDESEVSLTPVT